MNEDAATVLTVNGINYCWPQRPIVVVCVDGGDQSYYEQGLKDGILPNLKRFIENGFSDLADGVVPSFTNPNNLSIVTGVPPSIHGISGNFFLEPKSGEAIMMNNPDFLRVETLFAAYSRAGAKVVIITAKDKLRLLLSKGMKEGICFSSEKADTCTLEEHGIANVLKLVGWPLPDVYSAELSLFAMEAGIRLLEREQPEIMYLSLTDYIQHTHPPGSKEANNFYAYLDDAFGRLEALGALVAITADHGMNDKSREDNSPNVIYLQDHLDQLLGAGSTRVILPITDPYVAHHGALGGFARIYCLDGFSPVTVIESVRTLRGIEGVYDRNEVCEKFDLPPDIEGDVAVISDARTVIGSSQSKHDLSQLKGKRLRSHGGVSERRVPFIMSEPLNETYLKRTELGTLRNFDIFDFAVNGTV
jgi:phosphonoacetate hydrolase